MGPNGCPSKRVLIILLGVSEHLFQHCSETRKIKIPCAKAKFQIEICRAALEALKSKTGPQLQSFYESLPEDIDSVDHFTFKDHFITVQEANE